jgi:hypothetical protein
MELHTRRLRKWRGGLEDKKPTSMASNFVLPHTRHDTLWSFIPEGVENGEEAWKIRKANKHGLKLCATAYHKHDLIL